MLLPEAERLEVTVALENMVPRTRGRFCSQPEHPRKILEEFAGSDLGMCEKPLTLPLLGRLKISQSIKRP